MTRATLFSAFVFVAALPVTHAQEGRPVAADPALVAPAATPPPVALTRRRRGRAATDAAPPVASTPAKLEVAAYYPPPGSLQAPLTAADVCRSLRGGLSGAEVAQDIRERGLVGTFGEDEAADARAAGAAPDFVAALQAGRFTVSAAYARRYAEQAAKGQRTTEANAWRAEAAARTQAVERENELRRQGQLAAENNRAIANKEREDKQRLENMKAKAEWESRRRENQNASGGFWYGGRWYGY